MIDDAYNKRNDLYGQNNSLIEDNHNKQNDLYGQNEALYKNYYDKYISTVDQNLADSEREIQSQKEQNIVEINEAVMASPEDAAKLLTSFIRE